jgi:dipeptidyl aminopeptidase/acylaminoacyl peptidase
VVPIQEAEEAYASISSADKEFKIVKGGNHSCKGFPEHQKIAYRHTFNWLNKHTL